MIQVKIPSDASTNVQRAFQDVQAEIRSLNRKLADLESKVGQDVTKDIRSEVARLVKRPTYQTWEEVFGSMGSSIRNDIIQDSQFFNVKSYGALGDGVTNDVVAIQAAITAAAAGGIVFFPAGNYFVGSALTSAATVTLLGTGPTTSTLTTTSATANILTFSGSVGGVTFYPYLISDLGFNSSVTRTAGSYIKIVTTTASNPLVRLRNLLFRGGFNDIYLDGQSGVVIDSCYFAGQVSGGNGVFLENSTASGGSSDSGDNVITNCFFVDGAAQADAAIKTSDGGAGLRISCNKILGYAYGIDVQIPTGDTSNLLHVNDNSIESTRTAAVHIGGVGGYNHVFISNNDFASGDATWSCVLMDPGAGGAINQAIISDNRIIGTVGGGITTYGIQLSPTDANGVTNVYVVGNIFSSLTFGLGIAANTGVGRVADNYFASDVATVWTNASTTFKWGVVVGGALSVDLGSSGAGGFLTVTGGLGYGSVEIASAKTDAADAILGLLDFVFSTNSSGHRRIASIASFSEGATANQRGGALFFYTKPNGSASLTQRGKLTANGNWVVQNGALATTAVDGFLYIPSCAGTPTGVPTAYAGGIPLIYDSINNILYARSNGAWRAH